MPKISVIIVSWNVAESLKSCLDSVFASKYPALEVIVIDNASSTPPSHPKIKLIQNIENKGFPKAVNQGLKISSGEYLLILNPDTRIPQDFFSKSIEFLNTYPNAGLMGPKFLNPDGTPQGSVFDEPSIFHSTQKYTPITDHRSPIIVNAISGACMFFSRTTYEKIGPMTEKVFMYYEDLDYCRRVRTTGQKIYFNPEITIIHEHGSSSQQSSQSYHYLVQSSIWYNGPLKHYLMTTISWVSQKIHKLFP